MSDDLIRLLQGIQDDITELKDDIADLNKRVDRLERNMSHALMDLEAVGTKILMLRGQVNRVKQRSQ